MSSSSPNGKSARQPSTSCFLPSAGRLFVLAMLATMSIFQLQPKLSALYAEQIFLTPPVAQSKFDAHGGFQHEARLDSASPMRVSRQASTFVQSAASEEETDNEARRRGSLVVDIISIGSQTRPDYQQAQKATFGSHPSVRNFFAITEDNDDEVDRNCSSLLTLEDVYTISSFCLRQKWPRNSFMRSQHTEYASKWWLDEKSNPVGWMCAQKRPLKGLILALESYREKDNVPDYVLLMDDDTYFQIDMIQDTLMREYEDPATAYTLAGCMIRNAVTKSDFTFPFGGWGTVFSHGAIVNLMRPVHCNNLTVGDDFGSNACRRLSENHLSEAQLFHEGMSIGELMISYASSQPFIQHANWTHGYCLHSDWIIGFFLNYYNIGEHSEQRLDVVHDRIRGYRGSEMYTGRQTARVKEQYRQCNHDSPEKCTSASHICHYQTPDRMKELAAEAALKV